MSRTVAFADEIDVAPGIFPYDKNMSTANRGDKPAYGPVRTVLDLGQLMRSHRKARGWTLKMVSGFANVSMRFLSELERGKETAEIGKALHALRLLGLEVVILPRREAPPSKRRVVGTDRERAE